jgi:hypothetical protein
LRYYYEVGKDYGQSDKILCVINVTNGFIIPRKSRMSLNLLHDILISDGAKSIKQFIRSVVRHFNEIQILL